MKHFTIAVSMSSLVFLSACGQNGGSSLPFSAGRFANSGSLNRRISLREATSSPKLYVSDPVGEAVEVYDATGKDQEPTEKITDGIDGPGGVATDSGGNLYVANTLNNTVTKYAAGGSSPVATYSTDLSGPVGVAVDAAGTVYVSNFYWFRESIVEFPKGSTNPSAEIHDPCSCTATGLTLDSAGNLYAAYQTTTVIAQVWKFASGSKTGTNLGLVWYAGSANLHPFFAPGLLIDGSGNLLVTGPPLPGVQVFPPGKQSASKVFGKTGSPQFIAFGPGDSDVFVADTEHNAVEEYSYPSGTLVDTIKGGLKSAYGVAVSP
jgi:hypothetical protein